ncbi:MAG: lytic transglycosylase domain-containing protein [Terracidiphilus sp.]|nr:lytic transglycosylase domain-containing protein [Terracidiphilus sp.]
MRFLALLAAGGALLWLALKGRTADSGGGNYSNASDTSEPTTQRSISSAVLNSLPADEVAQIWNDAEDYGIDPNLAVAMAYQESRGKQSAVSPAGAIGVFQLMPATAAGLGVDPYDRDQNIQGGISYLKQLLDKFGGNEEYALAAYNAGPGAVEKYGGIPPYAETQDYVSKIEGYLNVSSAD